MAYTTKKTEDEWFVRNERDLIKGIQRERERKEREREASLEQEEAKRRKELHWMKCPKCGSDMKQKEIAAINIDQCTLCEGIYFDRGELDEFLLQQKKQRSFARKFFGLS